MKTLALEQISKEGAGLSESNSVSAVNFHASQAKPAGAVESSSIHPSISFKTWICFSAAFAFLLNRFASG